MYPVANDFTEIARRLKEIQAEAADERPAVKSWLDAVTVRGRDGWAECDDMAACA